MAKNPPPRQRRLNRKPRSCFNRLLKNAVFWQPVCGTGRCRHFQWLKAIENEGSGKPRFPLPWLKKPREGLFQHPVNGWIADGNPPSQSCHSGRLLMGTAWRPLPILRMTNRAAEDRQSAACLSKTASNAIPSTVDGTSPPQPSGYIPFSIHLAVVEQSVENGGGHHGINAVFRPPAHDTGKGLFQQPAKQKTPAEAGVESVGARSAPA